MWALPASAVQDYMSNKTPQYTSTTEAPPGGVFDTVNGNREVHVNSRHPSMVKCGKLNAT